MAKEEKKTKETARGTAPKKEAKSVVKPAVKAAQKPKAPAKKVLSKAEEIKEVPQPVIIPPKPVPPPPVAPEKKRVVIDTPDIVVKDLADKMGIRVGDLIKALMLKGIMATINQRLKADTIKAVVPTFDMEVEIKEKEEGRKQIQAAPAKQGVKMQTRHPVVTIMGHVDHGKTRLLDTIRNTHVIDQEAGGITQHIGAYQVEVHGRKITFLDTPGHEAFTALRARGARVTDIVVLVVAADEGVKPQTVEAVDHARAAGVPIIVAVNKIDKPEANVDLVKKELSEIGLSAEDWGGATVTVPISAKTGKGIDELLEMILLVADMQDLMAPVGVPAVGVVVESKLDRGRGPVATVLVKSGTLGVGDYFAIGATSGKVRAIINDKGKSLREAGPSMPVEVLGSSEVPQPGDLLHVVASDREAKKMAYEAKEGMAKAGMGRRFSLEAFSKNIKEGERKDLTLIIKTDVLGSLEALQRSLQDLTSGNVHVKIIHGGVGNINESDIMLAEASQAIVVGFNAGFEGDVKRLAEEEGVDVRIYNIIYNVIDDVKLALDGLLAPEYEEVSLGVAEVRQLYRYSKIGTIAGCFILQGKMTRGSGMRIKREGVVIHEGKIESLKRFKEDVREVEKGYECGIAIKGYENFHVGDAIESFEVRVKPRSKGGV